MTDYVNIVNEALDVRNVCSERSLAVKLIKILADKTSQRLFTFPFTPEA